MFHNISYHSVKFPSNLSNSFRVICVYGRDILKILSYKINEKMNFLNEIKFHYIFWIVSLLFGVEAKFSMSKIIKNVSPILEMRLFYDTMWTALNWFSPAISDIQVGCIFLRRSQYDRSTCDTTNASPSQSTGHYAPFRADRMPC